MGPQAPTLIQPLVIAMTFDIDARAGPAAVLDPPGAAGGGGERPAEADGPATFGF
jgi:hypothetical protein